LGSAVRYGPELEQRLRSHLKPTNKSWRVDETHLRVKGRWCYLYRAIDSTGATIDFLLSALRDAAAAKRLFRQALSHGSHPQPRVINTDQAAIYGSAIPDIKKEGILRRRCRHRPVQAEPVHRHAVRSACLANLARSRYKIPRQQDSVSICKVATLPITRASRPSRMSWSGAD
jgi:transposase-like protein